MFSNCIHVPLLPCMFFVCTTTIYTSIPGSQNHPTAHGTQAPARDISQAKGGRSYSCGRSGHHFQLPMKPNGAVNRPRRRRRRHAQQPSVAESMVAGQLSVPCYRSTKLANWVTNQLGRYGMNKQLLLLLCLWIDGGAMHTCPLDLQGEESRAEGAAGSIHPPPRSGLFAPGESCAKFTKRAGLQHTSVIQ